MAENYDKFHIDVSGNAHIDHVKIKFYRVSRNFRAKKFFPFLYIFQLEHESARYFIECSFFTQQNYNALKHRFRRVRVASWAVDWNLGAKSGVKNRLGKSCFGFVINSLSPIYLFSPFIRFLRSSSFFVAFAGFIVKSFHIDLYIASSI